MEVGELEVEASSKQHPRNAEPLKIENAEANPLVAALPVNAVQEVVECGDLLGEVLRVRFVEERFGTVDLHLLNRVRVMHGFINRTALQV